MKKSFVLFCLLLTQAGFLLSCNKDESTTPVAVKPEIEVSDIVVKEANSSGVKAVISVYLSEATTVDVSFNWSTEDGTAKAGEDYVSATDSIITFAPGETSKKIYVNILSDDILEFNENFSVLLTNIQNATAAKTTVVVGIEDDDSYQIGSDSNGYITPSSYPGMTLIWSDEFDGSALNTSYWNYETGGGGWGNNELEVYTSNSENSYVQDGFLTIKATKNPYTSEYNSARLTTKGKKEFTYGRIDIRAKLPIGQGLWPALWMLGSNISSVGWPSCGEIDIMEYLGNDALTVYGTAHYNDGGHQSKGGHYKVSSLDSFHDKFHVYSIVWQKGSIDWYVDYHKYFTVTSSSVNFSAFNLPQFFIFNVAVGGNWPGNPNAFTVFPQTMMVDYVRIFQ